MILELTKRVEQVELELDENQKNPEQIAINKGQNIQAAAAGDATN